MAYDSDEHVIDVRTLGKYPIKDNWVRSLAIRQPWTMLFAQPNPEPLRCEVFKMGMYWDFGMLLRITVECLFTADAFERVLNWFNARQILHVYGCSMPLDHYDTMVVCHIEQHSKVFYFELCR